MTIPREEKVYWNNDGLVKSRFPPLFVIPVKTGIQCF